MHRVSNPGTPDLNALSRSTSLCARLGRLLLALAAVVLVAMPWTQHMWTWDRFLHGGQDFETGVLLIVTSMCLVLVLAHACRQAGCVALGLQRLSRGLPPWKQVDLAARAFSVCLEAMGAPPQLRPTPFNLPLQI